MTATSIVKAVELDFAEFASTLISETLKAVISSILTQEKQVAEIEQQAMVSPEEYARANLTDEIIRAEILHLFPSTDGREDKSSVDPGEPYSLIKEQKAGQNVTLAGKEVIEELQYIAKTGINETEELPAIRKKIDYTITEDDLTLERGNIVTKDMSLLGKTERVVINTEGYNRIYIATKLTLANHHLVLLRQIVSRGIPRVYVNDGHIKSKLMLRFESQTTSDTTNTVGSKIAGLGIRKLIAQPVNATKPEYLTLNTDILSEVEITFKTAVP
jgi:hypothetical protein